MKKVIWRFEGNKAPRSVGFSVDFFKKCWEVVKDDILSTIQDFHSHGFFDKGSNATFISLIPKR